MSSIPATKTISNLDLSQHDSALLYFDEPWEFNDYVQPIEIADHVPKTDDTVIIAGEKSCLTS